MFELVKALNDGAKELNEKVTNSISLNAGCELFIAFVTLSTHESDVSITLCLDILISDTSLVSRVSLISKPN